MQGSLLSNFPCWFSREYITTGNIVPQKLKQGSQKNKKIIMLQPFETCGFFNTKIKGAQHLQVYNVRIPVKQFPLLFSREYITTGNIVPQKLKQGS